MVGMTGGVRAVAGDARGVMKCHVLQITRIFIYFTKGYKFINRLRLHSASRFDQTPVAPCQDPFRQPVTAIVVDCRQQSFLTANWQPAATRPQARRGIPRTDGTAAQTHPADQMATVRPATLSTRDKGRNGISAWRTSAEIILLYRRQTRPYYHPSHVAADQSAPVPQTPTSLAHGVLLLGQHIRKAITCHPGPRRLLTAITSQVLVEGCACPPASFPNSHR